jgi:NAD-dependent dihydropyrimidine dehydrogenase PreA subunit
MPIVSITLTVILSRTTSNEPSRRDVERRITETLQSVSSIEFLEVPELYHCANDSAVTSTLQGLRDDLLVLSWLSPRATHWTLNQLGIRGRFSEPDSKRPTDSVGGGQNASIQEAERPSTERRTTVATERPAPKRTIYHIKLQRDADISTYRDQIQRLAGETTNTADVRDRPPTEALPVANRKAADRDSVSIASPSTGPNRRRWYPVIDFDRCTNCMECIDFCLFGVYGIDHNDIILVEQPDNCRQGCPACSRVCPDQAIMFPLHQSPAISGHDDATAPQKLDLSQLFGRPDPKMEAEAERDQFIPPSATPRDISQANPASATDSSTAEPRDELDRLMDELDESDLDGTS